MNDKKLFLYVDLGFCLLFLPLILLLMPVNYLLANKPLFLVLLILYILGIYIFNRKFDIPGLFLKKRFLKGMLLLLPVIIATYLLISYPLSDTISSEVQFKRAQLFCFLCIIVMGYCFATRFLIEFIRQVISTQTIEAEKNKAELALFKAQIEPHFLFNTLNTLYGLLITKSDKVESAFVKFSDILRYMHLNSKRDTISIREEIDYIQQYVDLQKFRLNEHTRIIFNHEIDDESAEIPPMILITFIENAFKYGVSSTTDCSIFITIQLIGGKFLFRVENAIIAQVEKEEEKTGIENCKKRLDLLYPGEYTLSVVPGEKTFEVVLNIQLNK